MEYLKNNGIETAIHYPTPLPFLKAYEYLGAQEKDFPVAVAYQKQILSLPIYPELEEKQIRYVADKIRSFYDTVQHADLNASSNAFSLTESDR